MSGLFAKKYLLFSVNVIINYTVLILLGKLTLLGVQGGWSSCPAQRSVLALVDYINYLISTEQHSAPQRELAHRVVNFQVAAL